MSKLDLEKFNEILMGGLKDQSLEGKKKFLETELAVISDVFMEKVMDVLDELEQNGYDSPKFRELQTIKGNSVFLFEQLHEIEKKLAEKEGAAGDD